MFEWYNVAGYAGVILVLLSFLLLQAGKLSGTGWTYQLMNLFSAIGIMASLVFGSFNLPAFLQELAWLLICIYGMRASRKWRKLSAQTRRGR